MHALTDQDPALSRPSPGVIIDAYNTVWKAGGTSDYLTSEDYTAEMMLEAMDATGVDMAMVSSLASSPTTSTSSPVRSATPTASSASAGGPQAPDSPAAGDAGGQSGVQRGQAASDHARLPLCRPRASGPNLRLCASTRLIVLVNALDDPFCAPLAIEEIASSFPEVPVVIAHMGSVWNVTEAILVAGRRPNIFLETSAAELRRSRTPTGRSVPSRSSWEQIRPAVISSSSG